MFTTACTSIRQSIYAVISVLDQKPNYATAFMISPGVCMTTASALHLLPNNRVDFKQVVRVAKATEWDGHPNWNANWATAKIGYIDLVRDLVLLNIPPSESDVCVQFESEKVLPGLACGVLGFPLTTYRTALLGPIPELWERFQAGHVSTLVDCMRKQQENDALSIDRGIIKNYEITTIMYDGSKGSPVFTEEGFVIGMQIDNAPTATSQPAFSYLLSSTDIIKVTQYFGIKTLMANRPAK